MGFIPNSQIMLIAKTFSISNSGASLNVAYWFTVVLPSSIKHLFGSRGPAAVSRFIVAVVVNAINRMTRRWTRAHVSKEFRERIAPLFANNYSLHPIAGIYGLISMAARNHILPSFVFNRSASSFGMSMFIKHNLFIHYKGA